MALKHQVNLSSSVSEYNRYLGGGFLGIDMTSDASQINPSRLALSLNMWKDYQSQKGVAVETIPGYRRVFECGEKINGLYRYVYHAGEDDETEYQIVHAGTHIRLYENGVHHSTLTETVSDKKSIGFQYNNDFYLVSDGYYMLGRNEYGFYLQPVSEKSYVPKTYVNGTQIEQANALSPYVINEYSGIADITEASSTNKYYPLSFYNRISLDPDMYGSPYYAGDIIEVSEEPSVSGENISFANLPEHAKWLVIALKFLDDSSGSNAMNVTLKKVVGSDTETVGQSVPVEVKKGEWQIVILSNVTDGTPVVNIGWNDFCPFQYRVGTIQAELDFHSLEYAPEMHFIGADSRQKLLDSASRKNGLYFYPVLDGLTLEAMELRSFAIVDNTTAWYDLPADSKLSVKYECDPSSFSSVGEYVSFGSVHTNTMNEAIGGCTLFDIFDNRIFLSGNPKLPNTVFYSARDNAGYFGVLNWFDAGSSGEPITAMIHNANNLFIFKGDTIQDSAVSIYTPYETGIDIIPKIYMGSSGLNGKGCKSVACNFRDDIVFLSEDGLDGIDRSTISLERAIGHRSSNVDAMLLQEDLTSASAAEWLGYLVIAFPNGHMYLADSRQVSTIQGSAQYEWYYLDGIGTWKNDVPVYRYAGGFPFVSSGSDPVSARITVSGKEYPLELNLNEQGEVPIDLDSYEGMYAYIQSFSPTYIMADGSTVEGAAIPCILVTDGDGEHYYLLYQTEEKIGGTFYPATSVYCIGENLYFGTNNGDVCLFNTDRRGERPSSYASEYSLAEWKEHFGTVIPNYCYDRCGHRYTSGIDTIMDDAGIPHLTKDTVKKSCVITMKSLLKSSVKWQTRTNRGTWSNAVKSTVSTADYGDISLGEDDFSTGGISTISAHEKEKKWVRKQYRLYSDEFRTPFGIYSIAYRYSIHGRIKN